VEVTTFLRIERVISVDDGYAVVEKLLADEYMEGGASHSDGSDRSRPRGA
jgi:hypothetical protein